VVVPVALAATVAVTLLVLAVLFRVLHGARNLQR
jgi:hypothetical protein